MVGAELWRQWNLHRHVALMTLAIILMIVIVTLFINCSELFNDSVTLEDYVFES